MRPFFIRNYNKVLVEKKEEFLEMLQKEANVWEKMYVKEEYNPSQVEEARN